MAQKTREVIAFTETLWPDERTGPWYLRANWVEIDGRPECAGLIIWHGAVQDPQNILAYHHLPRSSPRAVRAAELRSLPIATIVERLRTKAHQQEVQYRRQMKEHAERPDISELHAFLQAQAQLPDQFAPKPVGRKPLYDLTHFVRVAEIYLAAWGHTARPTTTVAEQLRVSRSTAAKWVGRAREMGLLGPATHGRPGAIVGPRLQQIRDSAGGEAPTQTRSRPSRPTRRKEGGTA